MKTNLVNAYFDEGPLDLQKVRVDLKGLVSEAVEASFLINEQYGVGLTVEMPAEPIEVEVDRSRITQALVNLLLNAARHTPTNGKIELRVSREINQARVSVTDTGIGISFEIMAELLKSFSRIHQPIQDPQSGFGVRLSLVRRIVGLHGGSISASSPGLGQGSTFSFRLPLSKNCTTVPTPTGNAPALVTKSANRLRLLIVDGNVNAANELSELLEAVGCKTAIANDGRQALQAFEKVRPHAVIVDIGLQGMNAYDVARAIRSLEGDDLVMLVALSACETEEGRKISREAGFRHHLTKPAEFTAVIDVLKDIKANSGTVRCD